MTRSSGAAVALPLPVLALIVLPVAVLIATAASILRQENPTLGCWILPNAAVAFAGSLDPVCPLKAYERIVRIDAGDQPVHRRSDLLAALPLPDGGPLHVTASRGSARRSVSIPIIDDSRRMRTAQLGVATALSAVLTALGLSLWLRRRSPVSTPIAILCTTSAIFLAATVARASTPILDLIWVLAQGLLAAALCHLALVYPRERRLAERVPGIVTLLYAGALALTAMEWVGFHHNDALWEIADRTVATWIVAAVVALGVSSLLALHETSSPRERVQARVLLMASSGAIALLATLALDPGGALPLAPRRTIAIALIGFLGLLTYLISRFGLLDVPLAVRWTAAHGVYATIVSGLAYGGLYFLSATNGAAPPAVDPAILYAGVFATLVLLETLRRFSWATTERWVTPWAPKLETLRTEGVDEVARAATPEAVAGALVAAIREGLDARGVAVFLPLGDSAWRLGAAVGALELGPELARRVAEVTAERVRTACVEIVDLGQTPLHDAPQLRALRRIGVSFVALLPGAKGFAGVLLSDLGRRPRLLSSDHHSFVEQLCAQAALALDNLHLQYHLLMSARMAAVGHTAAGLAHDLGRPLGEIYLEARRDGAESSRHPDTDVIAALASECLEHLERFVTEGKEATESASEKTALAMILEAACDRSARLRPGPRPLLRLPPHLPEVRDPSSVQRVVENLLENAMHWSDPDTPVEVYARLDDAHIVIQVIDHGPGLSAEAQSRAFDPFFSERGGSGLGLAICKDIVEGLGGTIAVDSTAAGARFSVTLPARGR